MELLVDWIKQIIIFLLLASIVDLLIPDSSMKKYSKLAIGLILIIIFLRPVLYFFTVDVEKHLSSTMIAIDDEVNKNSFDTLIKMEKKDIQAKTDAYIIEQIENQLINIAKQPLQEKFAVEIISIDFLFLTEAVSYENLNELIVKVQQSNAQEGVVSIVENIEINMNQDRENDVEVQSDEQIKEVLFDIWELEEETLTIMWGEGAN